jgi:peptide/nickel transport system ATP-binding protein
MNPPLVEIQNLKVHFPVRSWRTFFGISPSVVRAVDGVTFCIYPQEILALVGESGCGKTTIGKTVLHLIKPTSGSVCLHGKDMVHLQGKTLRDIRRKIQLIFQDPYESLDPRQSVFDIVAEPLIIHKLFRSREDLENKVYSALDAAGLYPPKEISRRYPHLLSGGQRQRVAIASTLVLEPEFIVADEPVSMLDVSIRAEIIRLMLDLRDKKNLTYLFITHDLSLAWIIADRIIVLYLGKIMEMGSASALIGSPKHPYTQALVSVIPSPQPVHEQKPIILKGETPSPANIPTGCRFHPRCWNYQKLGLPDICVNQEPDLRFIDQEQFAACHFS